MSSSNPLVLITGATGHLGFRTLVLALQVGYKTRVAVRKLEQGEKILATASIKPFKDFITFVEVPDITAPNAYDQAIEGVEYAIHIASPIPTKPEFQAGDWKKLYYDPAVNGTLSILTAAAKTTTIKRLVITSSVGILKKVDENTPLGPNDIQSAPSASAAQAISHFGKAYETSKVLAYHAAKNFTQDQKNLHFTTAFILPGYIQGPNELLSREEDFFTGSNEGTINAILGNLAPYAKPTSQVWLDDAAKAHVVALKRELEDGEVLIVASKDGKSTGWDEVGEFAAKTFPEAYDKGYIKPVKGQEVNKWTFDVESSEKKLGFGFAEPEVWIKETTGWWLRWHGYEEK